MLRLKDICIIDWGNTSLTKKSYEENGKYLAVSAAGADGKISHYEHEVGVCVLSAIGAQCGKMFFPQQRFTAIKNTITLTPLNEIVDSRYLYYLFTHIELPKRGAAQPFISKGDIEKFELPYLPSLEVQRRIAEKLDKAFTDIHKILQDAHNHIESYNELLQAALNEVSQLHGDEVSLKDVCGIKSKLVQPTSKPYLKQKHIGAGNIVSYSNELINVLTAEEEKLKSGKFPFGTNEVLYSKIRPYLQKVHMPFFDGICSADIYPLTPNKEKLMREFLYYLLLSKDFTDYAISGSARAGMPKVNRGHLFSYSFPLPPLEEQDIFIQKMDKFFSEIEGQVAIYKRKVELLTELKSSILSFELKESVN